MPTSIPPVLPADLIPGLAALSAYGLGWVLRRAARAQAWSESQKRAIPRLAVLMGSAVGYAAGTLINGGSWREVAMGALGGAAAVAVHESTRPGRGAP